MIPTHAHSSLTLGGLWQFSLDYYAVNEVKEACLCLQNQFQGNVNLLLLLKWLDEQQLSINDSEWPHLLACLSHSESLVHSFRELRRKLKSHLSETLYREALQFELRLEKQQQAELIACVQGFRLSPTKDLALTERYCRQLGAEHLISLFSTSVKPT